MLPDDVKLGMIVRFADANSLRERWGQINRKQHAPFNASDMAFMCGRRAIVTEIHPAKYQNIIVFTLQDCETGEILNHGNRGSYGGVWTVSSYMFDHEGPPPLINLVQDHSLTLLEQLESASEQQYLEILRGH